jgi:hypothetical protein
VLGALDDWGGAVTDLLLSFRGGWEPKLKMREYSCFSFCQKKKNGFVY